jgi:hypothetical protein
MRGLSPDRCEFLDPRFQPLDFSLADTRNQETLRKFACSYIDMQGAEAAKVVRVRDERFMTP